MYYLLFSSRILRKNHFALSEFLKAEIRKLLKAENILELSKVYEFIRHLF